MASDTRARVVLNGLWQFKPAADADDRSSGWGWARVPGTWHSRGWNAYRIKSVLARGTGAAWEDYDPQTLSRAWYRREIRVPDSWQGRSILLELSRVSTDAAVYLDGKAVGEVRWPYGVVDLTSEVEPGGEYTLDLLVAATTDAEETVNYLDANSVMVREASLQAKGLPGDVILKSEPTGATLDAFLVQPSVRDSELGLAIELADVREAGPLAIEVTVRHPDDSLAREFQASGTVEASERQRLHFDWPWDDPVLWDLNQPFLYEIEVRVDGPGFADTRRDRFGFREFEIEGRRFLLNGKPIHLRPVHHDTINEVAGIREAVQNNIEGFLANGFNAMELWPKNSLERGSVNYWPRWPEAADEKGFLILYPALSITNELVNINNPEPGDAELDRYERLMAERLREVWNHPSIIMWTTTANRFAHADDQNPRRIGQTDNLLKVPESAQWYLNRQKAGRAILDRIRAQDPTRPVTSHHAGALGEVHTMNTYLCMLPLQEREEWLSQWAERGDKPFMAVEMGTPWFATFLRGRTANVPARRSERLFTEFTAWYLGPEAYAMEPERYREHLADTLVEGQDYKMLSGSQYANIMWPAFLELQQLFTRNTWRSWRAWGHSGGSIPWSTGFGWIIRNAPYEDIPLPPFKPGRLGPYQQTMKSSGLFGFLPGGYPRTPVADVFNEVNGPTLAWIAGGAVDGDPGAFTAKDHHFESDAMIGKQIILHNDTRSPQPFHLKWTAAMADTEIDGGIEAGTLAVGEQRRLPIAFGAPEVAQKRSGAIRMTATIGNRAHTDTFAFRVFPEQRQPGAAPVYAFDPKGETSAWLETLGIETVAWDGKPRFGAVLVVGRHAFAEGDAPGDIAAFAEAGGRVLVFGQAPEWWRDEVGLRVAPYVGRRYWPVASQTEHPVIKGLDDLDFRDWVGRGSLLPETANLEFDKTISGANYPPHGWRWGNRGSVSSAALEKPHHSGLTPLLEGQFDLAFSPLMELRHGAGLILLNNLDVERRGEDPVATRVTRRLVEYAKTAELPDRPDATYYLGAPGGRELLDSMGVAYSQTRALPDGDALLVVGAGHGLERAQVDRFLEGGGRVFALPGSDLGQQLGFETRTDERFAGSLAAPEWPEARGLSASDLRLRAFTSVEVFSEGPGDIGAKGSLARYRRGGGSAILVAYVPDTLDAERLTYFRYSSWRWTRALAQLLANQGARFRFDDKLLAFGDDDTQGIGLADGWELYPEGTADTVDFHPRLSAGGPLRSTEPENLRIDGAIWYRTTIELPETMQGKALRLHLGPVDDFDRTFVNGQLVGSTGKEIEQWWDHPRDYAVPAELTKAETTIAVRVYDRFGKGGFGGGPEDLYLLEPESGERVSLAGLWRARIERAIPTSATEQGPHEDDGVDPRTETWKQPEHDVSEWFRMPVPGWLEKPLEGYSGELRLVKTVQIPEKLESETLTLRLAEVTGLESIHWNGEALSVEQGATEDWSLATLPTPRVKSGPARIELEFELNGGGEKDGLYGPVEHMEIAVGQASEGAVPYVRGYRDDFKFGDDPFRYYRW